MKFFSPLDGRYFSKISELAEFFSEFGLVKNRVEIEGKWLEFLAEKKFFAAEKKILEKIKKIYENFSEKDFAEIKKIEQKINHDVKSVEYFWREKLPRKFWPWIHFAATSEDINNLAHGKILNFGREKIVDFLENKILKILRAQILEWKKISILARTHGQPATPSTVGKEFLVFFARILDVAKNFKKIKIYGKFAGATGNFAAHAAAFPEKNWPKIAAEFVEKKIKLKNFPVVTQILPHDDAAAILHEISRLATIFVDFSRDIWNYISRGFFGQKKVENEVGSSTMPHKINPINFENAEGNFKFCRGICRTLADELPISRMQRDLTDSTLQRNFGLIFGHFFLAEKNFFAGLQKLEIREKILRADLQKNPEILAEPIQTILRKNGDADAYEKLKKLTRGEKISLEKIKKFAENLEISAAEKKFLQNLTPEKYTGFSEKIVDEFFEKEKI